MALRKRSLTSLSSWMSLGGKCHGTNFSQLFCKVERKPPIHSSSFSRLSEGNCTNCTPTYLAKKSEIYPKPQVLVCTLNKFPLLKLKHIQFFFDIPKIPFAGTHIPSRCHTHYQPPPTSFSFTSDLKYPKDQRLEPSVRRVWTCITQGSGPQDSQAFEGSGYLGWQHTHPWLFLPTGYT